MKTQDSIDYLSIASNGIVYTLINFLTGPLISAYTNSSEDEHTLRKSIEHRFAKTFENGISNNASNYIFRTFFNTAEEESITSKNSSDQLPYFQNFREHIGFQALQFISKMEPPGKEILSTILPTAYLTKIISNLDYLLINKDAIALEKYFSETIDDFGNSLCNYSSFSKNICKLFTQTDSTLSPKEAGSAAFSEQKNWTGHLKDYFIFSIFHALKIATKTDAQSKTPVSEYMELVADDGKTISLESISSTIANYIIETRESALDAITPYIPHLKTIQSNSEAIIQYLKESQPQKIKDILQWALPSDDFYAKHPSTHLFKEFLTALAVTIPATGIGIHLLPKIFHPESLPFSIIMETSTNVIIHLSSRMTTPLSDFMNEKSLAAMKDLHAIFHSPQTSQTHAHAAHGDEWQAKTSHLTSTAIQRTIHLHDLDVDRDPGDLYDDSVALQADNASLTTTHDLLVCQRAPALEGIDFTAMVVGVPESYCLVLE